MRILLEDGAELELDDAISVTELAEALAERAGVDLRAQDHLLVLDPDRYWQAVRSKRDLPVAGCLRPEERGEPLPFRLVEQELCRHGSPAVPGRGFLCGWC